MIYLVDRVQVAPADVPAYLQALSDSAYPVLTGAGLELESCRATAADLGLDVDVEVVWRVESFEAWNEIRRDLVRHPGWRAWARRAEGLRRGGSRRFMFPVDLPVGG